MPAGLRRAAQQRAADVRDSLASGQTGGQRGTRSIRRIPVRCTGRRSSCLPRSAGDRAGRACVQARKMASTPSLTAAYHRAQPGYRRSCCRFADLDGFRAWAFCPLGSSSWFCLSRRGDGCPGAAGMLRGDVLSRFTKRYWSPANVPAIEAGARGAAGRPLPSVARAHWGQRCESPGAGRPRHSCSRQSGEELIDPGQAGW
jgi:hypothetical protein